MKLFSLSLPLVIIASQSNAFTFPTKIQANESTFAVSECKQHVIHDGDTCVSIARANNVTYAQILAWNRDLKFTCTNIRDYSSKNICVSNPSGNFTIPNNSRGAIVVVTTQAPKPTPVLNMTNERCGQYHKVSKGDDCSTIEAEFGTPLNDFIFLNPEVGINCTHLLLDYYYCVRPMGAISTYPGHGAAHADDSKYTEVSMKTAPKRNIMASYRTDKPTIPMANGTRRDCSLYFWLKNDDCDCSGWSFMAGVSLEEFTLWNPSLEKDKNNINSKISNDSHACTISASSSYCLQLNNAAPTPVSEESRPSPRGAKEIANCTAWSEAKSWTICDTIVDLNDLTMQNFYSMNPSVGENCEGLAEGTYYCVSTYPGGYQPYDDDDDDELTTAMKSLTASPTISRSGMISTPSPIQTGLVSTCQGFYKVAKDDSCSKIAQSHRIALSDFSAWNPAVGSRCYGLQTNVYVCVSAPQLHTTTFKPATTTKPKITTATPNSATTPSPRQTGMANNCKTFNKVKPDDECLALAEAHGITSDEFYRWNPAVKKDCSGLQANVYVCISV